MSPTNEPAGDGPRRVLVTGAAGKLGTVVSASLAASGVDVVAFDRVAPAGVATPGVTVTVGDLTDPAAVRRAVDGCDGVVHLAKYRGDSDTAQFSVNTSATYNVLAACADAGIHHAVVASSVCAYGMTFARRRFPPRYVPLDEDHPLLPQDSYSLSKVVDEATARAFVDGHGMSVVALRFHGIRTLAEARSVVSREPAPSPDLWSYIDVVDAARACRLGLGVPAGFHALNICAADTLSTVPTMELLARFHPETAVRSAIEATDSPWSTRRAREVLGFVPRHSWRTDSGEATL